MYIVTAKDGSAVVVQKVLHPLLEGKGKLMSKIYKTDQKRLKTIHRQHQSEDDDEVVEPVNVDPLEKADETVPNWSPVDIKFFTNDDSDDEENLNDKNVNYPQPELQDNILPGDLFLTDEEDVSVELQHGADSDDDDVSVMGNLFNSENEVELSGSEYDDNDSRSENIETIVELSDADIEDNDENMMNSTNFLTK